MRINFVSLLVVVLWLGLAGAGWAQDGTDGLPFLQGGVAVLPSAGMQAGYVGVKNFYTVEGMLYVHTDPKFAGGDGGVQVSGGLGGALRPLGVLRTIGNASYAYDVFVGFRFGPSLFFADEASRSEKNQQFSLFGEPFVRFTTRLRNDRIVFIEAGIQRPLVRAGLWFGL